MEDYQVNPGFAVQGRKGGEVLELDPESPQTIQLLDTLAISQPVNPSLVPVPPESFRKFRQLLQATPIFGKVYTASKVAGSVAAAYALVMNAIDNREPQDFEFALRDLVSELDLAGEALTPAETTEVNTWLQTAGFSWEL